jgi:DNA-binding NtrC family response regulator
VLVAEGEELTLDLLPARIRNAEQSEHSSMLGATRIHVGMTLGAVEKEFIALTLMSVAGNKQKAAKILGISRRALYDKLKKFHLS